MARTLLGKLKRGLFMTHTEFLEKAGEAFRRTGPVEPSRQPRRKKGRKRERENLAFISGPLVLRVTRARGALHPTT